LSETKQDSQVNPMKYRQCCALARRCCWTATLSRMASVPTTRRECCRELKRGIQHIQSLFLLCTLLLSLHSAVNTSTTRPDNGDGAHAETRQKVSRFFFFFFLLFSSVQLEQQHAKSWNAGQFLVFLFCSSQLFIIFFYKGRKRE
jgi:hypothetical protein